MHSTQHEIQTLMRRLFDSTAFISEFDASNRVSPFLLGEFDFFEASALGETFVIAAYRSEIADLDAIASQMPHLSRMLSTRVVPYLPSLEAADRRSLIENRSDFLSKNGDAYLPFLGLHLRATARTRTQPHRTFRASDQSVFLFGLYAKRFTATDIRNATGLSFGSISRALQNMMRARMIDFCVGGKTSRLKEYFKPDERLYFVEGRRLFGRSVVSSVYTDTRPDSTEAPAFISGLSALGKRSNLLGPNKEIWATYERNATRIPAMSDTPVRDCRYEVQMLAYDPAPFAPSNLVDVFTMLVTIPEELLSTDERVRIALREAMEGYAWYQD